MSAQDNTLSVDGLVNHLQPAPDYVAGGQPDADQLRAAADNGLKRVINLRGLGEDAGYDEAARAAELGLEYHNVAVSGPQELGLDKARELDALLGNDADGAATPTLVHCASGARVGALMALRAGLVQNKSREEALRIGQAWGMKPKHEAIVNHQLDTHAGRD